MQSSTDRQTDMIHYQNGALFGGSMTDKRALFYFFSQNAQQCETLFGHSLMYG